MMSTLSFVPTKESKGPRDLAAVPLDLNSRTRHPARRLLLVDASQMSPGITVAWKLATKMSFKNSQGL
jgi:hypothetical protein